MPTLGRGTAFRLAQITLPHTSTAEAHRSGSVYGRWRPEHEDRSGEWVLVRLVLHQRRQPVVPLAEVHWLGRHHDPDAVRRKDHVADANARATATILATDAPSSRRIVTGPTTISARETALVGGGSGVMAWGDISTTMAATRRHLPAQVKPACPVEPWFDKQAEARFVQMSPQCLMRLTTQF